MILSKEDIRRILRENPTKAIWAKATQESKKLQTHILGHNLEQYVDKIEGFESVKAAAVRKKYCKSNRDMFARVLRPIDNVWNGRGGARVFLTSEANQKRIRKMLLDVWNEYSLERWVRSFWLPRYKDDPMGLIFMEVDHRQPNGVYPTYKASKDIFDALPRGRRLEYIVFRTADPMIFRVVDDEKDVLVKVESDTASVKELTDRRVTLLDTKAYPKFVQWFDQVPAIIVSDIPRDGADNSFMSPVNNEIELADNFLRDGSISNIYRFKNGFPLPWKYPEVCGTCKGQKQFNGQACADCNGTGIRLENKAGDISVFGWPTKDEPEIKDKGGFISPDLEYLKYSDGQLEALEELITRTHWGTYTESPIKSKDPSGEKETATKVKFDQQPKINRTIEYAQACESIEMFIVNHIGQFNLNTAWNGCSINKGRRFLMEQPDEIWNKYEKARKEGSPIAALDDLLRDYYETKYQANEMELQVKLVLAKLEPGVHMTIAEAKTNLPWNEYNKKVYFGQFVTTKTELYLISTKLEILRQELETYATDQAAKAPVDPKAPKLDENNNPLPAKVVVKPGVPV